MIVKKYLEENNMKNKKVILIGIAFMLVIGGVFGVMTSAKADYDRYGTMLYDGVCTDVTAIDTSFNTSYGTTKTAKAAYNLTVRPRNNGPQYLLRVYTNEDANNFKNKWIAVMQNEKPFPYAQINVHYYDFGRIGGILTSISGTDGLV